jgi:hypothetical protein
VAGPFLDAFPQARAAGNVTITLDWKTSQPTVLATGLAKSKLGWELDLYVKTPDGTYVGGDNRGDLLTAPYVKMPRDSSVDLLPMETIVISNSAPDGEYKVFADKPVYAGPPVRWNNSWTYSQASVQVYNGSTLISPYYAAPPIACGSVNRYWHIGNVTKTGTSIAWSEVNTCTNTKP